MEEPEIVINGVQLTISQAMTVRVAIETFSMGLVEDGLGDDNHGKKMVELYGAQISELRKIIYI